MSEKRDEFYKEDSEDHFEDYTKGFEDNSLGEQEQPLQFGAPTDETYQQQSADSELIRKRKKTRNAILIGTLGILLPILAAVSAVLFVFLSIIGALENCAVVCCQNCSDSCAQSCQESCCQGCSDSCNNACNESCSNACSSSCSGCTCSTSKITLAEKVQNNNNLLKWFLYSFFGFLFK